MRLAEECFAAGIPAIVSMHSMRNPFHSTVRDCRSGSLTKHSTSSSPGWKLVTLRWLYVHDEDTVLIRGRYGKLAGTRACPRKRWYRFGKRVGGQIECRSRKMNSYGDDGRQVDPGGNRTGRC